MKLPTHTSPRTLIGVGVFFIGGIIIGWLIHAATTEPSLGPIGIRGGGEYQYINPLLECEVNGGFESNNLTPIKTGVVDIISRHDPSIEQVSVYFRDLNNGPWFGIEERAPFAPASLLKVPTMIAYLKKSQDDPSILQQPLVDVDDGSVTDPEEMLQRMIAASDNEAFEQFVELLGDEYINDVHTELGLETADAHTPEDFITVKNYASLFRVLYNASYLNRSLSEYALSILADAQFDDGITAGVPDTISVANKFGITGSLEENTRQLHDCGIVYYPDRPYLLCIMTRGDNTRTLASLIAEISNTVYQQIDAENK